MRISRKRRQAAALQIGRWGCPVEYGDSSQRDLTRRLLYGFGSAFSFLVSAAAGAALGRQKSGSALIRSSIM